MIHWRREPVQLEMYGRSSGSNIDLPGYFQKKVLRVRMMRKRRCPPQNLSTLPIEKPFRPPYLGSWAMSNVLSEVEWRDVARWPRFSRSEVKLCGGADQISGRGQCIYGRRSTHRFLCFRYPFGLFLGLQRGEFSFQLRHYRLCVSELCRLIYKRERGVAKEREQGEGVAEKYRGYPGVRRRLPQGLSRTKTTECPGGTLFDVWLDKHQGYLANAPGHSFWLCRMPGCASRKHKTTSEPDLLPKSAASCAMRRRTNNVPGDRTSPYC